MAVKQTAGRDALGEFAPKFAELNDDVLFGQFWSREDRFSLRDRSIVTVVALMAQGTGPEPAGPERCGAGRSPSGPSALPGCGLSPGAR